MTLIRKKETAREELSVLDLDKGYNLLLMLSMKETYSAVESGKLITLSPFQMKGGSV